jgi:hypothetical protein
MVSPGRTPVMVPVKVGFGVPKVRVALFTVTVRGDAVTVRVVERVEDG